MPTDTKPTEILVDSNSIVRSISQDNDETTITFQDHSGVFTLKGEGASEASLEKLKASLENQTKVSFYFNRDLHIVKVC